MAEPEKTFSLSNIYAISWMDFIELHPEYATLFPPQITVFKDNLPDKRKKPERRFGIVSVALAEYNWEILQSSRETDIVFVRNEIKIYLPHIAKYLDEISQNGMGDIGIAAALVAIYFHEFYHYVKMHDLYLKYIKEEWTHEEFMDALIAISKRENNVSASQFEEEISVQECVKTDIEKLYKMRDVFTPDIEKVIQIIDESIQSYEKMMDNIRNNGRMMLKE